MRCVHEVLQKCSFHHTVSISHAHGKWRETMDGAIKKKIMKNGLYKNWVARMDQQPIRFSFLINISNVATEELL